jgi:hypothetical protein
MTAPARIKKSEVDQVASFVKRTALEKGRVIFDLANSRIEVIIGDAGESSPAGNPWDEDDKA